MATGPEHYREAEKHLASAAQNFLRGDDTASALAAAQVHATLALTAAQAARLADPYVGDGDHINAWRVATGTARTAEHTGWCQTTEDGPCTCDAGSPA